MATTTNPLYQTLTKFGSRRRRQGIWNRTIVGLLCCSFVVSSVGCSSLTTTSTLALDDYEIPKGDFTGLTPPVVDANGIPQVGPQKPPAELSKISLPDYIIEPPDVLLIEELTTVPREPLEIKGRDVLQIVVLGAPPERPIAGQYQVEGDGFVNLGPGYGRVNVGGLTTDEAAEEIRQQLLLELQAAQVAVTLPCPSGGGQFVTGQHLVGPDGTVNLGQYGRVYVAGMTLDAAREAVQERLSRYFENPRVTVDIFVYNSKYFYVIVEGGGAGDQVIRIPVTGNEMVLDAISQIGGIGQVSSKKMWISRPSPAGSGCDQILPIDWDAITRGANPTTNYQLLPGDRLFVAENHLIAWTTLISTFTRPFETMIGFTLLSGQTVQMLQRFPEGFRQF